MSEVTKPIVLNETVQALNSKIDATNGYLQRIAAGVAPNLITKTITEDGTYIASDDNADGYSEVTVDVPNYRSLDPDSVIFIDYDGTVLRTYTKDQFLALTEMPANPTHTGLTAQGWNWSLADAKDYVEDSGRLVIGQQYITDDGKTRIYIHLENDLLKPELSLVVTGTCYIDWGDGTSIDNYSVIGAEILAQHTYSSPGDYIISIDVDGSYKFAYQSVATSGKILHRQNVIGSTTDIVYLTCIQKIHIGNGMTEIDQYAFARCYSLKEITIPKTITSISGTAFQNCYSIEYLILPESVSNPALSFSGCLSLVTVSYANVHSNNSDAYKGCYSLFFSNISKQVTTVTMYGFQNCYFLKSIYIPDSVTEIQAYAFNNCINLESIALPEYITSIPLSAFQNCYSLKKVIMANRVTTIAKDAFNNCYSLVSITASNALETIGRNSFYNCVSLASITLPASLTTIEAGAFYGCYGLRYIKFESTTPPTVSSSDAFDNVPTDCIIYVPAGSLSDYTSATNYPNPNIYTYVEY